MGLNRVLAELCFVAALLLVTISTPRAEEQPYRIIKVKPPFSMGTAESDTATGNDYYVTIGQDHGLQKGGTLNVYRTMHIEDELTDASIPTVLFIGQIKAIEVQERYCVARLTGLAGSDNPLRERDAVLVGDYVLPVLVIQGEDLFAKGSSTLLPKAIVHLEAATKFILIHSPKRARIEGHTDNDGTPEYNLKLSELRAAAVRDYLVNQSKINPSILSLRGYGESNPIAPNDTPEGQARNRRFEIVVEQ